MLAAVGAAALGWMLSACTMTGPVVYALAAQYCDSPPDSPLRARVQDAIKGGSNKVAQSLGYSDVGILASRLEADPDAICGPLQ